jgi:hypothetical protein
MSAWLLRARARPLKPVPGQRIRHYGFLANANRVAKLARIRELLPPAPQQQGEATPQDPAEMATQPECAATPTADNECQPTCPEPTCPECGGEMEIVETLVKAPRRGAIDTS